MPALAVELTATALLDPHHVVDVVIKLPDADWQSLRSQSRDFRTAFSNPNAKPYSYVKAQVTVDGVTIHDVGIRKKGFIGSQDTVRPSLKIKLDKYVDQQPIKGLGTLTLNNNKQDRSLLSQMLTYQVFRKAGVHAPRCTLATVTVNGNYLGIYTHVESVKEPYLQNEFGDGSGKLYEGTLADFHSKGINRIEAKNQAAEADRSTLATLAKLLNAEDTSLAEIESIVDVDNFVKFWVIESLIGFWDGYTQNQNNYFMYENPANQKLYFMPWGADGCFTSGSPFRRFSSGAAAIRAESTLANRLYHMEGVAEKYRDTLISILDDVWNEADLLGEATRIEKLIFNDITEQQLDSLENMNRIRDFIRGRRAVIMDELSNWPLEVPAEPRKPMYSVEQGHTSGSFATTWRGQGSTGKTAIQLTLDEKEVGITQVEAFATEAQIRQFGQSGPLRQPPCEIRIVCTTADDRTLTLRMQVPNRDFGPATKKLSVTGSFSEGEQRGWGAGKMVEGELTLEKASMQDGDPVSGTFQLKIAEIRGGMMDRRRGR